MISKLDVGVGFQGPLPYRYFCLYGNLPYIDKQPFWFSITIMRISILHYLNEITKIL